MTLEMLTLCHAVEKEKDNGAIHSSSVMSASSDRRKFLALFTAPFENLTWRSVNEPPSEQSTLDPFVSVTPDSGFRHRLQHFGRDNSCAVSVLEVVHSRAET